MDSDFAYELRILLNKFSAENDSNTPDFVLMGFILNSLNAFNSAVKTRADWYGRMDKPGQRNLSEENSALREALTIAERTFIKVRAFVGDPVLRNNVSEAVRLNQAINDCLTRTLDATAQQEKGTHK